MLDPELDPEKEQFMCWEAADPGSVLGFVVCFCLHCGQEYECPYRQDADGQYECPACGTANDAV
jgi:hypothetical protein